MDHGWNLGRKSYAGGGCDRRGAAIELAGIGSPRGASRAARPGQLAWIVSWSAPAALSVVSARVIRTAHGRFCFGFSRASPIGRSWDPKRSPIIPASIDLLKIDGITLHRVRPTQFFNEIRQF